MRWTGIFGLAVACTGGAADAPPRQPPQPEEHLPAGHPSHLDLQTLPYADEAVKRRFLGLVDATASTVPGDWIRRHARRTDGTVSVRWCSPAVPDKRCTTGSVVLLDTPGVAWRAVSVFPSVDGRLGGLGWEAGEHPAEGVWGLAQEQVTAPADSTRPEGWWVGARARTEQGVVVVPIADAATWTIDGVRVGLPAATPAHWLSEAGLRSTFKLQQDTLQAAVFDEISKGADRCVPDRPARAGQVSQTCTPRPLDAGQQAALRSELLESFAQRQALVDLHGAELAALLLKTRPPQAE